MTSKQLKKGNEVGPGERHDPFAVDIFVEQAKNVAVPGFTLESVKASSLPDGVSRDWSKSLESIEYGPDKTKSQTPVYPTWLENEITRTVLPILAEFAGENIAATNFEVFSYEDVEYAVAAGKLADTSHVIVQFESGGSEGILAVSSEFVSGLIDRVLGGTGQNLDSFRKLSGIEMAICEYLSAAALSGFNHNLDDEKRLRIIRVGSEKIHFDETVRAVEIVGDLAFENLSGMVSLLLRLPLLENLNKNFEVDRPVGRRELAKRFEKAVRKMRLFLDVGGTAVPAVEIPFLERDDVVLVTEAIESWWDSKPAGHLFSCRVGASSNIVLRGLFDGITNGDESGFKLIESVSEGPSRRFPRISKHFVDEGVKSVNEVRESEQAVSKEAGGESVEEQPLEANASDQERDESLVALENVMVDLRVLVAGKKISLSELGELRAGQIVDLGCRPEDPVELVAENSDRSIATGELVRIDGQLGVRITKVFV